MTLEISILSNGLTVITDPMAGLESAVSISEQDADRIVSAIGHSQIAVAIRIEIAGGDAIGC